VSEPHGHASDLVGEGCVPDDGIGDELPSCDTLHEHLELHPMAEIVRQAVERLRRLGQDGARLRSRQGGIEVHPARPERDLHPGVTDDLARWQGHAIGGQTDAGLVQDGSDRRDGLAESRLRQPEPLLEIGHDCAAFLLIEFDHWIPGRWRLDSRGDGGLVPATRECVLGDESSVSRRGRDRADDPGHRGLIQLAPDEPIGQEALIEQRGQQQRLVLRVAGMRAQRPGRATQDALVRLIANLVGHEAEDLLHVVVKARGEIRDRVIADGGIEPLVVHRARIVHGGQRRAHGQDQDQHRRQHQEGSAPWRRPSLVFGHRSLLLHGSDHARGIGMGRVSEWFECGISRHLRSRARAARGSAMRRCPARRPRR
jgi:hypothetical protein